MAYNKVIEVKVLDSLTEEEKLVCEGIEDDNTRRCFIAILNEKQDMGLQFGVRAFNKAIIHYFFMILEKKVMEIGFAKFIKSFV